MELDNVYDCVESILQEKGFYSFVDRLDMIDFRHADAEQDFKDSLRASAGGLQSVYEKFKEIESRQIEIEKLLKSERVIELVSMIPTENDIERLILRIEKTEIGRLNEYMEEIRNVLEDLNTAFL